MDQKKHDRFRKVAERRVNQIILDFEKLGNCSSKASYNYTPEEVEKIMAELEYQFGVLRDRFSGKRNFSLQNEKEV